MYRPTSSQSSFIEPLYLYSGFLPKNDWSDIYRDKIWPIIDEEKFRHLYQEEGGAPNRSIKLKLSLLIFMSWEKLTWRGTEFMFPRRLDWINATCSQLGEKSIDHTTLFIFYQALANDKAAYQLFAYLTKTFVEECGISVKKQRTDSFFMQGWLALLSRYGLFKETIRTFLMVLRKHQYELYDKVKDELSYDYLKDDFDLTEKDKEKARLKTEQMAHDLFLLKSAFENHEQIKDYDTYKTLVEVFKQQCEVKENQDMSSAEETLKLTFQAGDDDNEPKKTPTDDINKAGDKIKEIEIEADTKCIDDKEISEIQLPSENEENSQSEVNSDERPQVTIREKPQGDKIISSPHNTAAEYTRKRKQTVVGHRAFATETCDPKNPFQLITDVNLEKATHSDAKEIIEIRRRTERSSFKPEKMYGDAGFVNGETIIEHKEHGIDLAGPSSGRSQSLEDFEKKDRPFDVGDFKISIDNNTHGLTVTACPAGLEPKEQKTSEKTGKILAHFERESCAVCNDNERCPVKIGKRVSTFTVGEKQYVGALRHHHYMGSTEYRKECAIRSGAESLVNELANAHGARTSNHKTEDRSRLQLLFSAISCNIKRYIKHSLGDNQKQRQMTTVP